MGNLLCAELGDFNAGSDLYRYDNCFLFDRVGLRALLRKTILRGTVMSFETILLLVVSALLLIYLTYALLKPEKF
ncbi:MAG TPA: K(+)-transporting ATPase subunit F [Pyrinomonadaceae bacterium]|nr:K(+)-transporting ATPase subunit F [Pyrinomonadaceae bacterium]